MVKRGSLASRARVAAAPGALALVLAAVLALALAVSVALAGRLAPSDGAGALSIRVTNPGGLVHSQQLTKGPASVFLQQNDFNLGFSLCDLSNKYKQAIYGVEDDELEGWMPTEHSPYFAFETKYTKASKRLMTAKTSLTLATAGCALDGKAFEASSFVDALEAVEAQC